MQHISNFVKISKKYLIIIKYAEQIFVVSLKLQRFVQINDKNQR